MAKKKTTKNVGSTAAPAKKGGRGGRKPGKWTHLAQPAVAQYRKDAKLSRARLAELLDVSPTSIQNWETGRSIPVKRFQQRLVELMSGEAAPAAPGPASKPAAASRSPRRADPAPTADGSPLQLQVTRLSVVGEVLKGYLATPQGAKVSAEQLVKLAGALRSALA